MNTIHYKTQKTSINNSMLLFLGTGEIDQKQYALWSVVAFSGKRINDSEQSEVYLDIEFATPLTYTENGNIKLLESQDELFFSKVHHFRVNGQTVLIDNQEKGSIQIFNLSKKADTIGYQSVVVLDEDLLEISYNGTTQLIVMNS